MATDMRNADFSKVYFVGIGGIGMSALARYFKHEGKEVAGYDRTPTPLTRELEAEGIEVHYDDDVKIIPSGFLKKDDTLVVYTPAIPKDHSELCYFSENEFRLVKRSEILGVVSQGKFVMAVAGTHGKTTTTTMVAWFNHIAGGGGSAFLGGISKNFNSNLVLGTGNKLAVEADEFDRSFLRLFPDVAVITAVDPDHLDIYGTYEEVRKAFSEFVSQIKPGGTLILKEGVDIEIPNDKITVYRYSYDTPCDFYAANIRPADGGMSDFDLVYPDGIITGCRTGVPGWINIENAVAAAAAVWAGGCDKEKLREAIGSFSGVKRRFDFHINTPELVYMDDYAHHPEELRAAITSLRGMFPERHLKVVFQPHLYTRTRDFAREFSEALSLADEVIMLPIYPARELPIEGVNSEMIMENITCGKRLVEKTRLAETLAKERNDVVVTFGAGDIDAYCSEIRNSLAKNFKSQDDVD